MSIQFRQYCNPDDYKHVSDFLIIHYQPGNADGNWLEPAWEYMHSHPFLDSSSLSKIGIWADAGEIVAVTHYESRLGEAFFEFHPGYRHLRQEMLLYAEENLCNWSEKDERRTLQVYVSENDPEFLSLVKELGYTKKDECSRPLYHFVIPAPFPPIHLPDGFCLKSLAEDCDWGKVHRVLWRGFDHAGEPPMTDQELEERRKMFDTPKARRDLKIVVEAPDGNFVAFCGMFYESTHHYAYVEPVATDWDYRRLGLGKAAVLEGIQRCGNLGATVAYVGSDQDFYQALGFRKVWNNECWVKSF